MLYYDRIDISGRIDPTKSNKNKEYIICHCWFLIMDSIMYAVDAMILGFCVLI